VFGAVYTPALVIVPTVPLPPAMPSTVKVTGCVSGALFVNWPWKVCCVPAST
jgi:hypothetical protein